MAQSLPVADADTVHRYARSLLRRHPRELGAVLGLHALVAVAGLVAPRLVGDLVEGLGNGITVAAIDRIALALGGFVLLQAVFQRFAAFASARLGERVLAELREEFVARVLALPLSTVERAGSGDLLNRSSRDVAGLSHSVRKAAPETMVALVSLTIWAVALVVNSPLLALPCLVVVPPLVWSTRWYLRRAPAGYLAESAAYSDITDGMAATVEGARTVEALGLQGQRRQRTDADIGGSFRAERYTLFLRSVWFPVIEVAFFGPIVATLVFGGWFYLSGWVTLGQVTAAVLYVQLLISPLDRLLTWLDVLQVGAASLARLLGVGQALDDRTPSDRRPTGDQIVADRVSFAYTEGRDVLRDVSLTLRPGERLAIVGPSGAGKSTLGRLLAGIHPPGAGSVTVGGAPLTGLPLAELRGQVALVTQEHHVFVGSLRDNITLARPGADEARLREALAAVDALDWALALPHGLDTMLGAGHHALTPAQAQQVALARLVLADPHTLVLDEATSLIDPRAARHLERSLAAVLAGRTVVAIAHRLFSAHDADRVAVVEDGRIVELGSHDELVAAGGSYAALWRSWHGASASDTATV
ncbi:ABC transporter ATP-binding protein [Pilimelia columellifera]|uniref:ABC transporter ATP-binding protein n=1 Tax=Pilimelia columellifera subsp. columellifera TaxID=706583 RepID=A0ABP6APV9_9ACTN